MPKHYQDVCADGMYLYFDIEPVGDGELWWFVVVVEPGAEHDAPRGLEVVDDQHAGVAARGVGTTPYKPVHAIAPAVESIPIHDR